MTLKLGTRGSKLALWQAQHVQELLLAKGVAVELVTIVTSGDQIQDKPLVDIGGKGLFLKEIEDALLAKTIDFAVHSLKDVPFVLPEGLQLVSVLKREDASDAFVSRTGKAIQHLPKGAKIGTSSLRRSVQLKAKFPDLKFVDLRGNVDTRLRKLISGEFEGLILASAGLIRLGLKHHITHTLSIVAAVGQGAIALECRSEDAETCKILEKLNHQETFECVEIEREFLRIVEGSCQTPLGCHVKKLKEDDYTMNLFIADNNGDHPQFFSEQGSRAIMQKTIKDFAKKAKSKSNRSS